VVKKRGLQQKIRFAGFVSHIILLYLQSVRCIPLQRA